MLYLISVILGANLGMILGGKVNHKKNPQTLCLRAFTKYIKYDGFDFRGVLLRPGAFPG